MATPHAAMTDFDAWLAERFGDGGAFTALIVLVEIGGAKVEPVASTFAHVIGDEIGWRDMAAMLDASGKTWDGVVFYAAAMEGGGALANDDARRVLRQLEEQILVDRTRINAGHFFDRQGRRMQIEEITRH
jgi:hypothetical protein